ncbi:hypothetical protein ACF1BN_20315 [Streptomyces sp. NPDC014861]|uniref:hypothetical protein n=1 Tax=Streptomyces sp. NPDC014861 TaxID=3364923 RepID=UPI0036F5ABF2
MTDKEDEYLRQLLSLLDSTRRLDAHTQQNRGQWEVKLRSSLAGDDAKSAPYQVSHGAWHALTVAVDHLQCLRSSLFTNNASALIHTHAQASLVRGVFENAARAVWLLEPANRLERITRRLGLQAKELESGNRVRELVGVPGARTREEHLQVLEALLVAAGAVPTDARKAVRGSNRPSYKRIVRAAGRDLGMGEDVAELIWSACSSLAHGDAHGTLAFLDRQIIASDGSVALAQVTGSISLIFYATHFGVRMIDRGLQLYEERATAHI